MAKTTIETSNPQFVITPIEVAQHIETFLDQYCDLQSLLYQNGLLNLKELIADVLAYLRLVGLNDTYSELQHRYDEHVKWTDEYDSVYYQTLHRYLIYIIQMLKNIHKYGSAPSHEIKYV